MSMLQANVWKRNMYVETTIPKPETVHLLGKAHNPGSVTLEISTSKWEAYDTCPEVETEVCLTALLFLLELLMRQ